MHKPSESEAVVLGAAIRYVLYVLCIQHQHPASIQIIQHPALFSNEQRAPTQNTAPSFIQKTNHATKQKYAPKIIPLSLSLSLSNAHESRDLKKVGFLTVILSKFETRIYIPASDSSGYIDIEYRIRGRLGFSDVHLCQFFLSRVVPY